MSDQTDTVTLTRAEYEALIERIEDAEDNAFLDSVEARERAIGREKARADYLPAELVRRLIDGEHPVRVWRAHRGLTREALAAAAGVAPLPGHVSLVVVAGGGGHVGQARVLPRLDEPP